MERDNLQKAKDYVFNLLSYRDRTKDEIRHKLRKKGYNEELIEKVIAVLTNLDYLDDKEFARKWVKERIKNKPRGRYMLRYELKKKGIDEKIIKGVLNKLINDEIELEITQRLAKKWLRKNKNKDNYQLKLKRYLHNKGISDYVIKKYLLS